MNQSTAAKPKKPYPDFPLTANGNWQWSKKIKGRVYYFGSWNDPDATLKRYIETKDTIRVTGRKPEGNEGFTIRDLCNHFLTTKKHFLENGELSNRTFIDYQRTTGLLVENFSKSRLVEDVTPDDFNAYRRKFAETRGPVALGNEIQRTRTVFGYAWKQGLIGKPVRFGSTFPPGDSPREAQTRPPHA